jgi:transcriptional repressor NrdR
MRCPKCGSVEDKVIDSRPVNHFGAIRRRRICLKCNFRFTTYEEIERIAMRLVKRDGRHEPFDRNKLLSGMVAACQKRPVALDSLEKAADEIIQEIESTNEREVPSRLLGIKAMEKLHQLDEVAYVRYASVYRRFEEVGEFIDEIKQLAQKPRVPGAQPDLFSSNLG